jgi:anti-sigma B factor antagonist
VDLEIDHVHLSDDVAIVTIGGEIDVYTAPRIRETIISLIHSGHVRLVLDMTRTEMMDSTGLGVLVGGLKRCVAKDGLLVIVLGHADILRKFNITGLSRVVKIFDDLPAATAMALDPNSKWNDPPQAHEYTVGAGWFELRVYTPDPGTTKALEGAVFSLLETFDIVPYFKFPKNNYGVRESFIGLRQSAGPVSLSEQLEALHLTIEKYADHGDDLPISGPQRRPVTDLKTILNETTDTAVQIRTILLVKAKKSIIIQSFNADELQVLLFNNDIRNPARLFNAIQSRNRRRSQSKET